MATAPEPMDIVVPDNTSAPQKSGRTRARNYDDYTRFIQKIAKDTITDYGVSSDALRNINCFVKHFAEKQINTSNQLVISTKHSTLQSSDMASALKLNFSGELFKQIQTDYEAALRKYNVKTVTSSKQKQNQSTRAELNMPVGRLAKMIRRLSGVSRVAPSSAVVLASALETLCKTWLSYSVVFTQQDKRKGIKGWNLHLL